jgi:hypothetical protein
MGRYRVPSTSSQRLDQYRWFWSCLGPKYKVMLSNRKAKRPIVRYPDEYQSSEVQWTRI